MRRPFGRLLVLMSLCGAVVAQAPESGGLERNRRLLEKWQTDPDHYQRLREDLRAFHALPPGRQAQIRELDRQLHEEAPATRARLWGVLERYVEWLARLPEADRRRVLEAPTAQRRLEVIRALKQQQWLDRLPRQVREGVLKLAPDKRAERIRELRQQEMRQRVLWQQVVVLAGKGASIPKPRNFNDLPPDVRKFFSDFVNPRLSLAERNEIARSSGRGWPEFVRVIAMLSDRYPVLPPKFAGSPITNYHQLPARVARQLANEKHKGQASKIPWHLQGKWPDFALGIVKVLEQEGKRPAAPLGASRPKEFPPPVRNFLEKELFGALSSTQAQNLRKLEGHWPAYPLRLLQLARRKHLVIPDMSLPGPPAMWELAALEEKLQEHTTGAGGTNRR